METEVGRLLWLIEAKRFAPDRKVGIDLVRSLHWVVKSNEATHGALVTTSTFIRHAKKLQKKHEYQLCLRDNVDVSRWIRNYRQGGVWVTFKAGRWMDAAGLVEGDDRAIKRLRTGRLGACHAVSTLEIVDRNGKYVSVFI